MRYRIRTLMIFNAFAPPALATLVLSYPYSLLGAVWLAAHLLMVPAAAYLWRHSATRGRYRSSL